MSRFHDALMLFLGLIAFACGIEVFHSMPLTGAGLVFVNAAIICRSVERLSRP